MGSSRFCSLSLLLTFFLTGQNIPVGVGFAPPKIKCHLASIELDWPSCSYCHIRTNPYGGTRRNRVLKYRNRQAACGGLMQPPHEPFHAFSQTDNLRYVPPKRHWEAPGGVKMMLTWAMLSTSSSAYGLEETVPLKSGTDWALRTRRGAWPGDRAPLRPRRTTPRQLAAGCSHQTPPLL